MFINGYEKVVVAYVVLGLCMKVEIVKYRTRAAKGEYEVGFHSYFICPETKSTRVSHGVYFNFLFRILASEPRWLFALYVVLLENQCSILFALSAIQSFGENNCTFTHFNKKGALFPYCPRTVFNHIV